MALFPKITVSQERDFERRNVAGKRESYLGASPVERCREDPAYREKVSQLREGLEKAVGHSPTRWVLDLGGNTGGETTVLLQEGFRMVLSDINEVALEIARARAKNFDLEIPNCVAADVHALPFASESFQVVMVIEALHHFHDYGKSLDEIYRCLEPGGGFVALEPNGWNPLRRLSELRDRFRGTIEKSFTRGQLSKLLQQAGFVSIEIRPVPGGRSALRMKDVPLYRRSLAKLHAWLQRNCPRWFGAYQIHARKPGDPPSEDRIPWPEFLETPGGGQKLHFDGTAWRSSDASYPDHEGVPVLIEADRSDHDA